MKKLTSILCAVFAVAIISVNAQTNELPVISTGPTQVFNGSLGLHTPLQNVVLLPNSTNVFFGTTNAAFIGLPDETNCGVQFISIGSGNVTLRLARSVDGTVPEPTPSVVLTANNTTNTAILGDGGALCYFIEQAENPNAFTNVITLKYLLKAPIVQAIPSTSEN
jgi:hypothetical protein